MNRFEDDDTSPTFWGAVLKALLWIGEAILNVIERISFALADFAIGCFISLFWFIFAILSYFFGTTIRALIFISILSIILSLLLPAILIIRAR